MRFARACILAGLALSAGVLVASPARAAGITIINNTNFGGFNFTNFDGPNAGTNAATGTNMNGISNTGTAVGVSIPNSGAVTNFTTNPLVSTNANVLSLTGAAPMAFGINSAGTVVGADGSNHAFTLIGGVQNNFIPLGGTAATAFGINDQGKIVGQYTNATAMPGFAQTAPGTFITINAPSGPDTVFAQGINNHGLIVGFYVGTDGQDHGFMANLANAHNGVLTGTAIADPTIPPVAGEPGATFVFSQILGINDQGLAVGYYQDSTMSQHGFLYNTLTGKYTFLDNPNVAFSNGVEVTQITGINNFGELTGFYTDKNNVAHGFIAAVPEPASMVMLGIGLTGSLIFTRRRMRRSA